MASIVYQAKSAMLEIKAEVGRSRHEDKQAGVADRHIYGNRTYERYWSVVKDMVTDMRDQYGVRRVADIKPEHVGAWIQGKMERQEWSVGTAKTAIAAIHKFEIGVSQRFCGGRPIEFVPRDLQTPQRRLEDRVQIRPFTPEVGTAIVGKAWERAEATGNHAPAIGLQIAREAGLRVSEVVSLRVQQIDFGTKSITGIEGKGGRVRDVHDLPQSLFNILRSACEGKEPGDRVVPRSADTLERWCVDAKQELAKEGKDTGTGAGVHGLRGAFARERIGDLMTKGLSFWDAVERLSQELGHTRLEIMTAYLFG